MLIANVWFEERILGSNIKLFTKKAGLSGKADVGFA
jgi:hypothetical protein